MPLKRTLDNIKDPLFRYFEREVSVWKELSMKRKVLSEDEGERKKFIPVFSFFPPIPFHPHSPCIHFYLPFIFHPSHTFIPLSPTPLLPRSIFSINYFFFPPIPFRPHSPFIHFYLPFNFHPSHNLSSPLPFLTPSFHWFIAVSCDPRLRLLFTYQSFAFSLSFSLISLLPSVSPFHLSVFCLQSPFHLSFAFRLSF